MVKAFQSAFPNESDVELLVKLHKTDIRGSPELDQLLAAIKLDPRIRLINQTMTRKIDRIMLSAHAFVSLHRAEGFGIPASRSAILWTGYNCHCVVWQLGLYHPSDKSPHPLQNDDNA